MFLEMKATARPKQSHAWSARNQWKRMPEEQQAAGFDENESEWTSERSGWKWKIEKHQLLSRNIFQAESHS